MAKSNEALDVFDHHIIRYNNNIAEILFGRGWMNLIFVRTSIHGYTVLLNAEVHLLLIFDYVPMIMI